MPRILLVDDSRDLRETLSTLLTMKGYSVSVAQPHDNILDIVHSDKPDVVLLHVRLEDEDGRVVCQAINKEFGSNLPVILTSGDYELLSSFREYGAVDYLEKPYELSVLLAKLEKVFSEH